MSRETSILALAVAWSAVGFSTTGRYQTIAFIFAGFTAGFLFVTHLQEASRWVVDTWILEDLPEFDDAEEAKVWLETRGYEVVHECEPMPGVTHVVGEKYSRVPLMGFHRDVHVLDHEEFMPSQIGALSSHDK